MRRIKASDPIWNDVRRFTATIHGFRNWLLWQGDIRTPDFFDLVKDTALSIRTRIEQNDDSVFADKSLTA